jgi:prepilin peptidase CpaA
VHLISWVILVAIAVSDARKYRIPNQYLLLLLASTFVEKVIYIDDLILLLGDLSAGMLFFIFGLLLYFLKAIAPGDVKLLGVVGFWLGWDKMWDATLWISLSTVLIGVFYTLAHTASSSGSIKQELFRYTAFLPFGRSAFSTQAKKTLVSDHIVMPFAPVVVIGLALNSYF